MQLKRMTIGATLANATCGLLGVLPAAPVAAQEVSDWEIDTSLLYYAEDNDRVTDGSLMISARRRFDEDRSLDLNLTVDVLTGATPSGAVPSSQPQTFTSPSGKDSYVIEPGATPLDGSFLDTRIALSGGWQQALGDSMRWSAGVSASHEYDYFHVGVNGRIERDFNKRNTTVYLGAAYAQDDIQPVGGAPLGLAPMLEVDNNDSKLGDDSKNVIDLLVGVTQVLSRRAVLEVAYSHGSSDGYLSDPYKFLSVVDHVTGLPVAGPAGSGLDLYLYESRPDSRTKQSLFAEWRYALDRDSMAVSYRIMDDDWGVASQTLDARYHWNFSPNSWLEPHLRYYTQSAADFYRTVMFADEALPQFASADHRLADLDAYTVGLKYGRRTAHGEFSVRLEYYHQAGDPSQGAAVGDLVNHDLLPPLSAVIAQFGYKFRF